MNNSERTYTFSEMFWADVIRCYREHSLKECELRQLQKRADCPAELKEK